MQMNFELLIGFRWDQKCSEDFSIEIQLSPRSYVVNYIVLDVAHTKSMQNSLSRRAEERKSSHRPEMMNKYLAFKCLVAITRQTSTECVSLYV